MRAGKPVARKLFSKSLATFSLQVYVSCIKEEKLMEITGAYEFKYLALTYNDIYEVNAANEVLLRHQAEHDPLTGESPAHA